MRMRGRNPTAAAPWPQCYPPRTKKPPAGGFADGIILGLTLFRFPQDQPNNNNAEDKAKEIEQRPVCNITLDKTGYDHRPILSAAHEKAALGRLVNETGT
jgi:hypothetical protein